MTEVLTATFWTIGQNNSGGIFDHDAEKGIGYKICVEAYTKDEAEYQLACIINSYEASYDCPCCGDRWSIFLWKNEGTAVPEAYEKPLTGGWGLPSYVHYLDGRIEAVTTEMESI